MATKFYLPSTGAAAVTPAWSTSWYGSCTSPVQLKAVTSKISSADATKTLTDADTSDRHYYFAMYVSDRLEAQTIAAQTIGVSIKCAEDNAKNNMSLHLIIRVVQPDGTTYRGTLIAFSDDGTEVATSTAASRYFSATSSALDVSAGDRIVIELGLGGDPASGGGSHNSTMIIGDNNGSDLDAADADTTGDPWVNFANTLTFYTTGTKQFELGTCAGTASPTTSRLNITKALTFSGCSGTATPTISKLNRTRPFVFGTCSATATPTVSILTRSKPFVFGNCNSSSTTALTMFNRNVGWANLYAANGILDAVISELDIEAGSIKSFELIGCDIVSSTILALGINKGIILSGCSVSSSTGLTILTRVRPFELGTCSASSSTSLTTILRNVTYILSAAGISSSSLTELEITGYVFFECLASAISSSSLGKFDVARSLVIGSNMISATQFAFKVSRPIFITSDSVSSTTLNLFVSAIKGSEILEGDSYVSITLEGDS